MRASDRADSRTYPMQGMWDAVVTTTGRPRAAPRIYWLVLRWQDQAENIMSNVTRFAITHVGREGLRRLTFAMQGRNTHATRAEAEQSLALHRANGLDRVLTPKEMATLAVRACECYPGHFDPVRYYFEDEER